MADNTILKYVSLSNLQKYDEKIKAHIATADDTLKTDLEGQVNVVAGALDGEIARAKAAEQTNAAAAQAAQTAVDTLAGKVGTVADGKTVMGIIEQIQADAYDDSEIRGLISGLDTNKADKTQVATDIAAAVKVETDARVEAVAGVQGAIDTLSGTHATDKKALEDAIALKADQTALDTVSGVANAAVKQTDYDTKVAALEAEDTRIAGLVASEAERAAEVESDFEERIAKMEVFWDTTEDADNVVNKLKEIQDYIAGDETGAAEMAGNIQANTQAIEAMDTAYKAADEALQGAINLKADASALEAVDGRVSALETASATHALKTEVQAVSDALDAYEDAHAGDYTNAQIDAAIKVNTDAIAKLNDTYATDAELAQAIEGAKTDASNKDAVVLAEAQKAATAVQTNLDTHTNNGDIHVTAEQKTAWTTAAGKAHEHNNLSVLEGVTAAKVTEWDKVSAKADATALQAESERAVAKENELAAAIAAFVECSEQDVLDLFNV